MAEDKSHTKHVKKNFVTLMSFVVQKFIGFIPYRQNSFGILITKSALAKTGFFSDFCNLNFTKTDDFRTTERLESPHIGFEEVPLTTIARK